MFSLKIKYLPNCMRYDIHDPISLILFIHLEVFVNRCFANFIYALWYINAKMLSQCCIFIRERCLVHKQKNKDRNTFPISAIRSRLWSSFLCDLSSIGKTLASLTASSDIYVPDDPFITVTKAIFVQKCVRVHVYNWKWKDLSSDML